jgi:hypothetical protein
MSVPPAYQGAYNQMMNKNNFSNFAFQQNLNRAFMYSSNTVVNDTYDFKVYLKDGTVKQVKSEIYPDTAAHSNYLLLVDKSFSRKDPKREQKIYANQTLKITRMASISPSENAKPVEIAGNATDSCWLFQVVHGKISAYSYLSETVYVQDFTVIAFQPENGKILSLTPELLEPLIKTDEKAYRKFMRKKYYAAILKFNGNEAD